MREKPMGLCWLWADRCRNLFQESDNRRHPQSSSSISIIYHKFTSCATYLKFLPVNRFKCQLFNVLVQMYSLQKLRFVIGCSRIWRNKNCPASELNCTWNVHTRTLNYWALSVITIGIMQYFIVHNYMAAIYLGMLKSRHSAHNFVLQLPIFLQS